MSVLGSMVVCVGSLMPLSAAGEGIWGRLANPGFENEPIKSVFFFTGSSRDGAYFYECNPTPNTGLYTIHPSDARHLKWSESQANRTFAVDAIVEAGANVNIADRSGETPLSLARSRGYREMVSILSKAGAR